MIARRVLFPLLLSLCLVQWAGADVYRWVDENGRVHFGDHPPLSGASEESTVETNSTPPPSPNTTQSTADRNITRQRLLEQYQKEREDKKEAAQKKRQEEEQRALQCARARDRLQNYRSSVLYDPQPNGERRLLSDAERTQALTEAEQAVAHWCN